MPEETCDPACITHKGCHTLAKEMGIFRSSVNRILSTHEFKQHQMKLVGARIFRPTIRIFTAY